MFFSLYRHTDDSVFDDFPKISNLSKDFRKFPRSQERCRTFLENFRRLPKISEAYRRLPKTFEADLKMFRSYTKEFKCKLRDKLYVSEIIEIYIGEDMENTRRWFRMDLTSGVFCNKTLVSI